MDRAGCDHSRGMRSDTPLRRQGESLACFASVVAAYGDSASTARRAVTSVAGSKTRRTHLPRGDSLPCEGFTDLAVLPLAP